jgi:hypothetical protein
VQCGQVYFGARFVERIHCHKRYEDPAKINDQIN